MNKTEAKYYETRFQFDPGRQKVWKAICHFLQGRVKRPQVLLELGCGYGDFINLFHAETKIAVDAVDVKAYLDPCIQFLNTDVTNLKAIPNSTIDLVFASNLLEHLDDTQLGLLFSELNRITKSEAQIILMQPNFRFCANEYFDDFTHKKVFSHVSLCDYVESMGFKKLFGWKKFLPLSMKSRLPKSTLLTSMYLNSPFKPLGKQMLFVFQKAN